MQGIGSGILTYLKQNAPSVIVEKIYNITIWITNMISSLCYVCDVIIGYT